MITYTPPHYLPLSFFGAKGDGTDDYSSIQAAINSGYSIVGDNKTYSVATPILFDNDNQTISNLKLVGLSGLSSEYIASINANHVSLFNCEFDRNNIAPPSDPQFGAALRVTGNNARLNNVVVKNSPSSSAGNTLVVTGNDCTLTNIVSLQAGQHAIYNSGKRNTYRNLYCSGVGGNSFVDNSLNSEYLVVDGLTAFFTASGGMNFNGTSGQELDSLTLSNVYQESADPANSLKITEVNNVALKNIRLKRSSHTVGNCCLRLTNIQNLALENVIVDSWWAADSYQRVSVKNCHFAKSYECTRVVSSCTAQYARFENCLFDNMGTPGSSAAAVGIEYTTWSNNQLIVEGCLFISDRTVSGTSYCLNSAVQMTDKVRFVADTQLNGSGTIVVHPSYNYFPTYGRLFTGSGSPQSVIQAPIGSAYLNTAGSTSTTLYIKESGGGSTGWVAK